MADYWQEWVSFRLDFDDSDNTFVWAMMTTMVTMTVIIGAVGLLCRGTCITDHIWLLASKAVVAKQRKTSVWQKDIKTRKNVSKTIWLSRCYGAKSSSANQARSLAWFSLFLFFSTLWLFELHDPPRNVDGHRTRLDVSELLDRLLMRQSLNSSAVDC